MSQTRDLFFKLMLPPGLLPTSVARQALVLLLESYRWLVPVIYESPEGDQTLPRGEPFIDRLLAVYDATEDLRLTGRTEREGMSLRPSPIYRGAISCWWPGSKLVRTAKARETHVLHVPKLMRLVGAPLAYTCLADDADHKDQWDVRGQYGTRVEFLNDYSEGLLGIFWRTFLGPPFTRLFGERLATLPAGTARDLGDGLWVIEPYAAPEDAFTEEGQARERAIIEHLGQDCFFDHERQLRPSRRPLLPALDVEALEREHARREYERAYGKDSPRIAVSLKMRDFRLWEQRHWKDEPPDFLSRVSLWALAHREASDFLEKTPEQVAEMLRAQPEEPPPPASAAMPKTSRLWVLYGSRADVDLAALDTALREQDLTVTQAGDHLEVSFPGAPVFRVRFETAQVVQVLVEKLREDHRGARLKGCDSAIQVEVTDLPAALDEVNTLIALQLALQTLTGGHLYAGWTGALTPPAARGGSTR